MARTPVTVSSKEFYESFVKRTKGKTGLTKREHSYLLNLTGEVMKDFIIEDGQIKMFGRLGSMMIRMVKPRGDKKAPLDFNQTRIEGCNVYHFNEHSDGYIARIIWERATAILTDKHMWIFKAVRQFKRRVSREVKTGRREYPIYIKS
jgi:hypothetical protein